MLKIYRNDIWIDKETRQSLWYPAILFDNLVKLEQTKLVGGEAGLMFYTHDSKSMTYAEEIQVKFSCAMSFREFPFDSHNCHLSYGTFSNRYHPRFMYHVGHESVH